jgi:hypothetical protein
MEEPMIEEPSVSDDAKVEHIIAVLKATPGCTGAGESPYNGPELNKMDVHVRVDGKMIRRSGSAEFDTKLKMALHVRGRVEGMVGKAVVALAEEQLVSGGGGSSSSTQPEPHVTEAEMAWLAAWMDQQSDPSAITHADAETALMQHRAQQAGKATLSRLKEAQVQLAKVRAAELRLARAQRDLDQAKAAMPAVEPQPKRARSGEPRQPRPYDEWKDPLSEFTRQEGMLWTRRRIQLSEGVAARLPEEMPRGQEDGPMYHWRRGLVFAVQDWAEGSKADAAKLVFALITELKLEVHPPRQPLAVLASPLPAPCRALSVGPFWG